MQRFLRVPNAALVIATLALSMLLGCSVPSPPASSADTAPPPIDPAAIPDAEIRNDPITPAGNTSPYTVNGQQYRVMANAAGYAEEGLASWYGLKFHGRPTANGERFSVYGPTGAHRSLPIPTIVRVTNLENQRSMVVRINDRGPFHSGRLVDLSYGAAVRLGFAEQGTARVRIEVLGDEVDDRRQTAVPHRLLQVGAFASESAAQALAIRCRELLAEEVVVLPAEVNQQPIFRVRAGPFATAEALLAAQRRLQAARLPQGKAVP